VDAGHGLAVRVRSGAAERVEAEGGFPMGVSSDQPYGCTELRLMPGERLVLFSDGLKEQQSAEGEEFGMPRILNALGGSGSCDEDVERLFGAVRAFAGGESFADDVTVASFELAGPVP
jgi:serine phosphatase RsbU (regulator of sigma subunit)